MIQPAPDGQNFTIEELVSAFTSNISVAMGIFFPMKIIKLHPSDEPWMTASLKNLIMLRQRPFHSGNINLWHHYIDKVRAVNADIPPLDMHELPAFLPAAEQVPVIYSYQVCKKLKKLNPYKAMGPDNIPPRLLKEFAYERAEPIADLFNLSLSSGIVPATWKCANIIHIPKEKLPKEESDLRPISLTPCISKVMKEFVAELIPEDIAHKIDHKQFASSALQKAHLPGVPQKSTPV